MTKIIVKDQTVKTLSKDGVEQLNNPTCKGANSTPFERCRFECI